jgi:hypothetical protein
MYEYSVIIDFFVLAMLASYEPMCPSYLRSLLSLTPHRSTRFSSLTRPFVTSESEHFKQVIHSISLLRFFATFFLLPYVILRQSSFSPTSYCAILLTYVILRLSLLFFIGYDSCIKISSISYIISSSISIFTQLLLAGF